MIRIVTEVVSERPIAQLMAIMVSPPTHMLRGLYYFTSWMRLSSAERGRQKVYMNRKVTKMIRVLHNVLSLPMQEKSIT